MRRKSKKYKKVSEKEFYQINRANDYDAGLKEISAKNKINKKELTESLIFECDVLLELLWRIRENEEL